MEEGAAAFGEEGDGGVAVLGDAAGEEDGEGDNAGGIEGHEDEVRARLRDDSDEGREEDHQGGVVAYPVFNINELQADAEDEEDSESPCENRRQVLLDNMVPQMLVDEMVRCEEQHEEDDYAETGEEDIHPVFAQ